MSANTNQTARSRLENVIALARVLERVDNQPIAVTADQYQALIHQMKAALGQELPQDALQSVLSAYPSAAEVYENLHYAQSGLSRASLERSVNSELLATQLIGRAQKKA